MSVTPYRSSVRPSPLWREVPGRFLHLSASAWLTLFVMLAFAGGLVAGLVTS
jgi:hypothetical protein